jgi:hypothetical protein
VFPGLPKGKTVRYYDYGSAAEAVGLTWRKPAAGMFPGWKRLSKQVLM